MKTLLVTGGCGFIGSFIIFEALKKKFKVINIDKISYCSRKLKIKNKNYKFIKADILSSRSIKKIFLKYNPNFIINAAAETHVDRSIENPKKFFKNNLLGTINLLNESIKYKNLRFVQISTDEVFGSLKSKTAKFNENSKYQPNSPYSSSKAASDFAVRSYGKTYNLDYIITHSSNNFGPYQYPEKLIPLIIHRLIEKKNLPIYGKGENIRDWIYVKDHAQAIIKLLKKGKSQNSYTIGSNNEISNIKLINKLIKIYSNLKGDSYNYKNLITFIKDRPGHDFRYAINNKKIKSNINWSPKLSFNKALNKTLNFYVKNTKNLSKYFYNDKWLKKKYNK